MAIISSAVALRVALAARGWPDMDSDLAVVGLMARHILYHGAAPVFFYGQHYNGPLDAYLAAAFFAVLGPTNFALNLSALPPLVLFFGATYALARAAYGPVPALLTLLYLALGPALALLMGSHYPVFPLVDGLGALLLLLAHLRLRAPAAAPTGRAGRMRILAHYAATGLVAGLGIWSAQLVLPFVAVALLTLALVRPREAFRLPGLVLLVGVAIGCWPLLAYNLQHGGITFIELTHHEGLPPTVARAVPGPLVVLIQSVMILAVGMPGIFGSPHVCLAAGDAVTSYPPALAVIGSHPDLACSGSNVAFSGAIMLCYAVAARQFARAVLPHIRALWSHVPRSATLRPLLAMSTAPMRRPLVKSLLGPLLAATTLMDARLALRGMLLATAAATLALDLTSAIAAFFPLTAARYLFPLYVTVPIVFGVLWERAAPILPAVRKVLSPSSSDLSPSPKPPVVGSPIRGLDPAPPRGGEPRGRAHAGRRGRVVLAATAIAVLLGFSAYGAAQSAAYVADSQSFALAASPADQQVLAALRAHGIARFAAPYWICYRLVFESDERTICAVHSDDGPLYSAQPDNNRYWPYVVALRRTAHPAYVFLAGSSEDAGFFADAAAHGWPAAGYVRFAVAGYAIYYYPGGED